MWVHESMQRRTSYFAPNAKLLRTVADTRIERIQLLDGRKSGPASAVSPMAIQGDGTVTAVWHQVPMNAHQQEYGTEAYMIRIVPGAAPRTVLRLPFPIDERMVMTAGGGRSPVPFTFTPEIAVAGAGDRVGQLQSHYTPRDSGSYTVSLFTANGDTLFARKFAYRGVPVSKAERDSAIASLAVIIKEASPQEIRQLQAIAAVKMPSIHAEAISIVIGLDDTVWIGHRQTAAGQNVTVLDNAGAIIGNVLVPPRSRLQQASRTQIWMTEKDDNDLTSIVHYRVTGLPCGKARC